MHATFSNTGNGHSENTSAYYIASPPMLHVPRFPHVTPGASLGFDKDFTLSVHNNWGHSLD